MTGCEKLIEAFKIFSKYTDNQYPTWCEHDVLHICDVSEVSDEDKARLLELKFLYDEEEESWYSFHFGS